MAYQVNTDCIACGACSVQCPAQAVTVADRAVIDPGKCVDCGICAGICPVNAPRRVKRAM